MDVEIPPAQDSPKHILNVLNDDCIQLVLRRLDNIRDIVSAAETCVWFQENVKLAFRTDFQKVRIGKLTNNEVDDKNTVSDRVNSFLNIFGHLITELHVDRDIDDEIVKMIADYCGKTLKILKCSEKYRRHCPAHNFKTRSRFQALEELEIRYMEVKNFKYYSQLKKLTAESDTFKWLKKPFPKLEVIELIRLYYPQCSDVAKFFKLNPQLESVSISFPWIIVNDLVLRRHVWWIRNLAKLFPKRTSTKDQKRKILITLLLEHIGNLRNLKSFPIDLSYISFNKMIDLFIEKNVPIENLFLGWTIDLNFFKFNQLKKLKKLKP